MEKGRLKIYFGYSAGVGKTYMMLKQAKELKDAGTDVVIGYIEPHGRKDTEEMAVDFECIPYRQIPYKGIMLNEFDVDAAIRRHPQLILVDELAHTNAIGSKNRKRYLDVQELLNQGIDVYTTVNVQHLEGVHDLVGAATDVDVNERIPDYVFDMADEINLVDIEPNALIERMREGKIYSKGKIQLALSNFFKESNLCSLRELAMRRSADRIEMKTNNGALKTKILVLISPSPSSAKNIRAAARMAEAYHCLYTAMYVETNGELSDDSATSIKNNMKLVKNTGGTLIVKYAEDIVDAVSEYVRVTGVNELIIGKTWKTLGKKDSLEEKFIASMPYLEVMIIPDSDQIRKKKFHPIGSIRHLFLSKSRIRKENHIANTIIDILNSLAYEVEQTNNSDSIEDSLCQSLSRDFSRSCMVLSIRKSVAYSQNGEDISLFKSPKERAVISWVWTNRLPAGCGTDTIREAEGIYFPLVKNNMAVAVIGFSCRKGKMSVTDRLIFDQLTNHLALYLDYYAPQDIVLRNQDDIKQNPTLERNEEKPSHLEQNN